MVRFGRLPAVCCLLASVISGAPAFAPVDRFTGRYVLVRNQSEDIQQAIERSVARMNFLVRPIARRQLRQKTILSSSFAMERSDDFLRVTLAGEPTLLLPLSGATVSWKAPDGETVQVCLVPGSDLVQIFKSKQGQRENRFTLSPDRELITMSVRITSRELPRPVEYRLVYRRV